MKRITWLIGCLLVIGIAGGVWADVPSDSVQLLVTPSIEYGVIIDTTSVDLGTVELGASTRTVNSIPVTSTGTVSPLEYELSATVDGGTWSLATTDNPSENVAVLFAQFNDADPGDAGYDSNYDIVDGTPQEAGDTNSYFEGNEDVDSLGLNVKRNLYLRLRMPTTTTQTGQRIFTVTVTAEAAN